MFHIELRQAPHRLHRFNLDQRELQATVLAPWVRGTRIEIGERVWDPSTASILVLEGPEIPIGRLTMGRGWAVAQREGTEVTAQVIAAVRRELADAIVDAAPEQIAPASATADATVLTDALGLELLRNIGETPMSLPAAWRIAAQRHPQLPAGAALDLTRNAVASLVRSRLARLVRLAPTGGGEAVDLDGPALDDALATIDAWTLESGPGALCLQRP
jgi:hypothetical protein